jgi:hypothetical protein
MAEQAVQGEVASPIIINLGKQRRKRIKDLKRSRGVLLEEVLEAVAQVNGQLGADGAGKVLVPVVLIYREKRRNPFRF